MALPGVGVKLLVGEMVNEPDRLSDGVGERTDREGDSDGVGDRADSLSVRVPECAALAVGVGVGEAEGGDQVPV